MNKEHAKKLTFILSSYFTKTFSSKYCADMSNYEYNVISYE